MDNKPGRNAAEQSQKKTQPEHEHKHPAGQKHHEKHSDGSCCSKDHKK